MASKAEREAREYARTMGRFRSTLDENDLRLAFLDGWSAGQSAMPGAKKRLEKKLAKLIAKAEGR